VVSPNEGLGIEPKSRGTENEEQALILSIIGLSLGGINRCGSLSESMPNNLNPAWNPENQI
jgi:hypothetical protein